MGWICGVVLLCSLRVFFASSFKCIFFVGGDISLRVMRTDTGVNYLSQTFFMKIIYSESDYIEVMQWRLSNYILFWSWFSDLRLHSPRMFDTAESPGDHIAPPNFFWMNRNDRVISIYGWYRDKPFCITLPSPNVFILHKIWMIKHKYVTCKLIK